MIANRSVTASRFRIILFSQVQFDISTRSVDVQPLCSCGQVYAERTPSIFFAEYIVATVPAFQNPSRTVQKNLIGKSSDAEMGVIRLFRCNPGCRFANPANNRVIRFYNLPGTEKTVAFPTQTSTHCGNGPGCRYAQCVLFSECERSFATTSCEVHPQVSIISNPSISSTFGLNQEWS